jgi:predicted CopG family antitoxin
MSMRTTVDIPDVVYRELKAKALRENRSVKELILRSVEAELRSKSAKKKKRVSLPLVPSKRPGSLEVDNDKIYDLISFP